MPAEGAEAEESATATKAGGAALPAEASTSTSTTIIPLREMSALGLIHGIYRGGVVHASLCDPTTSNHRQQAIWAIAKTFGTVVAERARERRIPISSLSVWTATLLVGLVGEKRWYCVFCDWPGVPTVRTLDLQGDDPPSVDALLAGADIEFADPRYAFAAPVQALDATDPVAAAPIESLVSEFFDFHMGVQRRVGDNASEYQALLAVRGKTESGPHPPSPGWRVKVKGTDAAATHLADVFHSHTLSVDPEDGRIYLRSSDFAGYADPDDVLNHAAQLLHIAAGVIHLWTGNPGDLRIETAELVHDDGSIEGQLASVPLSTTIWSRGGKAALIQPGPGETKGTLGDSLIKLAAENVVVQRVLKLVAQTDRSWADLFTILDTIASEMGGAAQVVKLGWATAGELERFKRTANTTELGRHAHRFAPPKAPITAVR